MTPDQIVERERSRALPGAVAAFAGIALIVIAIVLSQSGGVSSSSGDAEFLRDFPDHRGTLLIAAILQGAGILFLIVPLFFLFQSADARSDRMRSALLGITVAGPLFLGIGAVVQWVGFDHAAANLGTPPHGKSLDDYAQDLIRDQGAYSAAQGLTFAGTLGLVVAIFYTALNAMRVGLLSRFWGTLAMALGVSVLFISLVGALIFFLVAGLLIGGFWPGGRPPAWDAGKAVPWLRPGETPGSPDGSGGEEPALPLGAGEAGESSSTEGSAEAPRKRKQRRD